jgi:hypothetical protein
MNERANYSFTHAVRQVLEASIGAEMAPLQVVAPANLFESLFSASAYKVFPLIRSSSIKENVSMYCPQCANPIDGTKFCRSCGTNVSLVPQALAGQLPAPTGAGQEWRPGGRHRSGQPPIDRGFVTTFFTGIAFLIATFIVSFQVPSGIFWGWSLLIPALACFGEAVGGYLKFRDQRRQERIPAPEYASPSHQPNSPMPEISAPTTSDLIPPTTITEDTTKRLEASRWRE